MKTVVRVLGFLALAVTGVGVAVATPITQQAVQGPNVAGQYGIPAPLTRGGEPFGVDIFVRGSFNAFGTSDVMSFDAGSQTYAAILSLDVGLWEFKIASEDWSTVDLGAGGGDPLVELDVPRLIGTGAFGNLSFETTVAGLYSFMLDTATGLETPTLLVSAVTVVPEPTMPALFGLGLLALVVVSRRAGSR